MEMKNQSRELTTKAKSFADQITSTISNAERNAPITGEENSYDVINRYTFCGSDALQYASVFFRYIFGNANFIKVFSILSPLNLRFRHYDTLFRENVIEKKWKLIVFIWRRGGFGALRVSPKAFLAWST